MESKRRESLKSRQVKKVPERCHPLVKTLFQRMKDERVPYSMICDRAGVCMDTILHWRWNHTPDLLSIEACLNVVGLEITVRKRKAYYAE